ncbi:hypothetical protein FDO65_19535 [Nakamurella flava]|uniref:Uncharacterized protein n=1 Tax=Nakamurella flava TaxID=2576308 RepID=A0A4U6QAP4_9ACTN|nr:hypothetical protein [Nakamurella flava]TKV57010.1 hypothetical protein FDO65_19535 [Nakamurella flava]
MDEHTTNGEASAAADELRGRVQTVITAADPEGLLALGAPDDEYSAQVGELTRRLRARSITAADVLEVWVARFGPDTWLADHPQAVDQLVRALNDVRPA